MMKIFVDVNKTLGNGPFIFLSVEDWVDFKTKEVAGSRINLFSVKNKEAFEVKSSQLVSSIDSNFSSGEVVDLEEVEMNLYVYNNFPRVSIKGKIVATGSIL